MMNTRPFDVFPCLTTDRLVLRETRPEDAEAILRIFQDEAVTRYHNQPTFTTLAQAERVVESRRRLFESGAGIRWCLLHAEHGQVIGACGYAGWDRQSHRAELGYELHRDYWGQGLMTEAVQAVLRFGFQQMDLNRIIALVMVENAPSHRLLQRLGFSAEGLLREHGYWKGSYHDLALYSLLRREWHAR